MRKGEIKQEQILNYISEYYEEYGFSPSYREIAAAVGIKSTNSVKKYVDVLIEKNLLQKQGNKSRTIGKVKNISEKRKEVINIPLVGKVAAGIPILAQENIEDEIFVSKSLFKTNQELFMLKVSGESMIEIGICDGDFVVVKKQNYAENGDIVVAYIDGYATVKTFYNEGTHIRLQPQNVLFKPILTDKCTVLGKVVGNIRVF